jgi:hypothetical protein
MKSRKKIPEKIFRKKTRRKTTMKKIRVSVLYNRAKQANTTLLFDEADSALIPVITDEEGNTLDNDFVAAYLANSAIFDRYIRNQHGKKLYSMYDEDLEELTPLQIWKAEIKEQLLINIEEFAGEYAKAMQKYKMQIGADLRVVQTLGPTELTMEHGAKHSEDTFGEDHTTNDYGAQGGSSTAAPRKQTTTLKDNTYEDGAVTPNLTPHEETVTESIQVVDSSSANAYKDEVTRDLRTDEHDSDLFTDTNSTIEVVNSTDTYNDLDYYRNMAQYPEFMPIMKKIINKIIIGTGVTYDY